MNGKMKFNLHPFCNIGKNYLAEQACLVRTSTPKHKDRLAEQSCLL